MSTLHELRCLVLDRAFQPVMAIDWRRAVVLDLTDRVRVLEYYTEVVRTARATFPIPAVILTPQWMRRTPARIPLTRGNLLLRDGHRCQYCGREETLKQLTIDHVLPRSRGGQTEWANVVIACGPCNRRKGSRTPHEAKMPLRTAPETPRALPIGRQGLWMDEPPLPWRPYLA